MPHTPACEYGTGLRFYLGAPQPGWLKRSPFPLFVSYRQARKHKKLPQAVCRSALDSGAYTELQAGEWQTTEAEYIAFARRYRDEVGGLDWVAPMDWLCMPAVIHGGWIGRTQFKGTGLSVRIHQQRTVENYLRLRDAAPDLNIIPSVQGDTPADFLHCAGMYTEAGVDLAALPLVGVGSIAGRQGSPEVDQIVSELAGLGLRLHGFGVKTAGLRLYAGRLASSDSMSWAYEGRRTPGCSPGHKNEANCWPFAVAWREKVLAAAAAPRQLSIWDAFSDPAPSPMRERAAA